ncbi:type I-U CRISPR-associated protein Csb2 [Gordonia sp. (in: high G+C Gram-positive bacteria)]|uniref:type I-G CRISPR-associated protein Csb2 n=1 Tax=Gordonia sp. (in: high G+C Gram-positive bacteria) TaxID=84139 RepID=UPI003526E175
MKTIGIRAAFPQGVYRGHTTGNRHDSLPSPLRLHSALVAAAGNGSTAIVKHGALTRTESAQRALEWLEDNPPDYVELPDWDSAVSDERAFAYMDEGVLNVSKSEPSRRKSERFVVDSTALDGPIGWGWESIPDDVAATLDELCADVPCLGETESPAVLEVREIEPTHRRAPSESPFAPVAIRLAIPVAGRLEELDALYVKAQPAKVPTAAADRWTATEQPKPSRLTHNQSVSLGYNRIGSRIDDVTAAPWDHVIHIAVDADIDPADRVQWAVVMHHALVAALGRDANSAITGRYPEGAERPANRVAIQYLDEATMQLSNHATWGSGFALLVTDDALTEVAPVIDVVKRLYRGQAGEIRLGRRSLLPAGDFWKRPAAGAVRVWCAGAVVPETRRQKPSSGRRWTLRDSALLSVGFVYRDRLGPAPEGTASERYRTIVERVETTGATVVQASPIPDSEVARYVHKLPQGVVAQPYRLEITPGTLIDDTGLIAVGQSRHLGGGLLIPQDLAPAVAEARGIR